MEISQSAVPRTPEVQGTDTELKQAAGKLEAVFIAEVLKSAGFAETPSSFGGGIGEDQFSSFLVEQHANAFLKRGGIGLAEHIFNAMKRAQ